MIKQEIIEKISKYFKLTHFEAEKIYDDIFAGIIQGVKEDNIADVTNFGEFIIKYNNSDSSNKKTVEFLPTLSLEEEINQRAFEESRNFEPVKTEEPPVQNPLTNESVQQVPEKPEEKIIEKTTVTTFTSAGSSETKKDFDQSFDHNAEEISTEKDKLSVEEEIKKKRDEILHKITSPQVELKNEARELEQNIKHSVTEPVIAAGNVVTEKTEIISEKVTEKISDKTEDIKQELKEKTEEVEDVKERSFSDFFTEVNNQKTVETSSITEEKVVNEAAGQTTFKHVEKTVHTVIPPVVPPVVPPVENTIPPVETVIPPTAVELHNQITGDNKTHSYQTSVNPLPFANGNGNGNGSGNGNGNGNDFEHRLQDNSYYIWYKDSEPNTSDTQTMSYEYELLYQATKEAEYKSKLRIYVTTFIMFFSIVLILLIFSPFIYKYFFTPKDSEQTEEVQQETSSNEQAPVEQNTTSSNNQASVNSLESNTQPTQQNTTEQPKQETAQQNTPPVQEQPKQEAPKQEAPKQEAPKQEQPKQEAPPTTQNSVPGVTKSSMGWMDDYNRVIYVQLDNGKFTIQESAWDSDAKANKRISAVAGLIPGLKGNVIKVDLGSKGTWYRARFGEFATIEEAKSKAEELRNKEKNRLQALLLTFLLYT